MAIVNPTRFNVELTYLGSGLLRTQSSAVHEDGTGEDYENNFELYGNDGTSSWISNAETSFPVKTLFSPTETSIYSGLTIAEEGAHFQSFSAQQKSAFEDCPAAAGWRVDMGMSENEMVPNSLADMVLTFYITGYHSQELKTEIDNAIQNEEVLVTNVFSAQSDFPDELFSFQRSGSIAFNITPEMLSINKKIGQLKELSLRLIPAKIDSIFTRFSSISTSKYLYRNNKIEALHELPQLYLEGDKMLLRVTLSNIKKKEIVVFAQENPSLILTRGSIANDFHVFDEIEFKKQGKQIVIVRDTTNGQLNDYPIEVFVSKSEKMILPTTTFTQAELSSNDVLKLTSSQLQKSSRGLIPTAFNEENVQSLIINSNGEILAITNDLSSFKLNMKYHENSVFSIISLYSKKIKGSFKCNQDITPFKEVFEKNVLRTNVKKHMQSNETATSFSKHLFGNNLKSKVKSPIDHWELMIDPKDNPFIECYDCNGMKKMDGSFIRDAILTMEYVLKPR